MKNLILLLLLFAMPFGVISQPTFNLTPQTYYGLDGAIVSDQPLFTASIYNEDWIVVMERVRGERIDMAAYFELVEASGSGNALLANPNLDAHVVTRCLESVRTMDECIAIHLSQRDRKIHLLLNPDNELYSDRAMLIDQADSNLRDLKLPLNEYLARWEAEMAALWLELGVPDLP